MCGGRGADLPAGHRSRTKALSVGGSRMRAPAFLPQESDEGVCSSFLSKVTTEFISMFRRHRTKSSLLGEILFLFNYSPHTTGELCLLGMEAAESTLISSLRAHCVWVTHHQVRSGGQRTPRSVSSQKGAAVGPAQGNHTPLPTSRQHDARQGGRSLICAVFPLGCQVAGQDGVAGSPVSSGTVFLFHDHIKLTNQLKLIFLCDCQR